jgi:hypothetical protein
MAALPPTQAPGTAEYAGGMRLAIAQETPIHVCLTMVCR